MGLRMTKKWRGLLALGRSGQLPNAAQLRTARSHEDGYWLASQAGYDYDADAGWFTAQKSTANTPIQVGIRFLGPRSGVVAIEQIFRTAEGFQLIKRAGPRPASGGASLTYLEVLVSPSTTVVTRAGRSRAPSQRRGR